MNIYDHAIKYAQAGLYLFPCHNWETDATCCSCGNAKCNDPAKHPLTSNGVYGATNDPDELQRFFTGDYANANIACATGEQSGVLVLDDDDLKTLAELQKVNGTLPKTWTTETGRGNHYYFRHVAGLKNAHKFCGSLDIRTTGGYVLLPPSLHASGNRYRWLISPDDCPLADAPEWLLALMPKQDETTEETPEKETTKETETQAPETTTNNGPFYVHRAKTEQERLIAYLQRCEPAIEGKGGMNNTFRLFCCAVELFGYLSDDDIIDAFAAWNARCVPPWTQKELRRKLNDARKKTKPRNDTTNDQQTETETETQETTSDDDKPTLHADAFHAILGDIVKTLEPETEADIAGVLLTLLAMLGNAIGKGPSFQVGGKKHYVNLFVAIVGETSDAKGDTLSISRHIMEKIDAAWKRDCISYGLSSGEGLIKRVKDDDEGDDKENEQTTPFVVSPIKRLLSVEAEAIQPITKMRRDGNTLDSVIRSAWDCEPLESLTKDPLRAPNAFVSLVWHITPSDLQKAFAKGNETKNGFANRFLWCFVKSERDLPNGGDISVIDKYIGRLKAIVMLARDIQVMWRSPDADKLWNKVYSYLKHCDIACAERARPQVLRLSMLYALCDGKAMIGVEHLKAALAVWRYCEDSALLLFDSNALASRLRSLIYKRHGIMRTELRQSISGTTPTEAFNAALQWLLQRGDIVCVECLEKRQCQRYYPAPKYTNETKTKKENDTEQYGDKVNESVESEVNETKASSPEPKSLIPAFSSITLSELLTWKNANAVKFINRAGGVVWVSDEYAPLLTPELEQAIHANQDTIRVFVDAYSDIDITDHDDGLLKAGDYCDIDAQFPDIDENGKRFIAELYQTIGVRSNYQDERSEKS